MLPKLFSPSPMSRLLMLAVATLSLFFATTAFATCTEEEMEAKQQAFKLRIFLIAGANKADAYTAAGGKSELDLKDLAYPITLYYGNEEKQHLVKEALNQTCKETDRSAAIADDILAGGKGTGKRLKKPWNNCAPEDALSRENAFKALCKGDNQACYFNHIRKLKHKNNEIFMDIMENRHPLASDMDKICKNYDEMLKAVRKN